MIQRSKLGLKFFPWRFRRHVYLRDLSIVVMRDILQSRYLRRRVAHKQLARTSLSFTYSTKHFPLVMVEWDKTKNNGRWEKKGKVSFPTLSNLISCLLVLKGFLSCLHDECNYSACCAGLVNFKTLTLG